MSFHLDTIDRRCLALMAREPQHASSIAEKLNINRPTIRYRLHRLEKHGLIKQHSRSINNALLWEVATTPPTKANTQVFRGNSFARVYDPIIKARRNTTIYSIQGVASGIHGHTNIPKETVQRAHRAARKKNLQIKGISHKEYINIFKQMIPPMLASHMNRRLGSISLVHPSLFQGNAEISCLPDTVIFTNVKKRYGVTIKDPAIVEMMYEAFSTLFSFMEQHESTRNYDLNEYMRNILVHKEKNHGTQT